VRRFFRHVVAAASEHPTANISSDQAHRVDKSCAGRREKGAGLASALSLGTRISELDFLEYVAIAEKSGKNSHRHSQPSRSVVNVAATCKSDILGLIPAPNGHSAFQATISRSSGDIDFIDSNHSASSLTFRFEV